MEKLNLFSRILENLLEVSCVSPDQGADILANFEMRHCFHTVVQAQLTCDMLEIFCKNLKPNRIYELQAMLEVKALFFLFDGHPVILGPFVEKVWEDRHARTVLVEQNLPSSYLIPYKSYYCTYTCMNTEEIIKVVNKITLAMMPEKNPYKHKILFALKASENMPAVREEPPDYEKAVDRYKRENILLQMIEKGDTENALRVVQSLRMTTRDLQYPILSNNWVASSNMLRTLLRKAAERGGVHPAVVDAISQEYAQKAYAARNPEEFSKLSYEMVKDFCGAVKKVQNRNYSSTICRAVEYIDLHYDTIDNLDIVARAAGITVGYLSHAFKAEVGCTVVKYIAKIRCEKAAEMLEKTNLPIQDISNHVGYLDNNYFVRVFKAQYHMTPSQYRKQGQNFSVE